MLSYEIHESLHRIPFGNIELHGLLPNIEVYLTGGSTDITEVGVGHFTRAIDDAPHDGDTHPFEVGSGSLDEGRCFLEVEERSTAGGAGDVIGLEDTDPGGLEDVVGEAQ